MNFSIQLHLNHNCNLRCRHCYQAHFIPGSDLNHLSRVKYLAIEICKDLIPIYNHLEFNLTGGEPLLYPFLWEVVKTIKTQGGTFNILTNGILIDDSVIAKLLEYEVKHVQISVDGLEETNDWIRGKNIFTQVMVAIERLVAHHIKVTVASTITRKNYEELKKFLDFFSKLDVSIGFHRYIPMNRQSKEKSELAINDPNIWSQIVKYLVMYKKSQNPRIVMNDPLFGLELLKGIEKKNKQVPRGKYFGCSIGISTITVMPEGTVYPCRKLPIPLGNAFETPLLRIWLDSKILWHLRDRSHFNGKCGNCPDSIKCGGCRADAYFSTTNQRNNECMFNEDHLCFN